MVVNGYASSSLLVFYVERKPDCETHIRHFYFLKASVGELIGRTKEGENLLFASAIPNSISVRCVAVMCRYSSRVFQVRNGSWVTGLVHRRVETYTALDYTCSANTFFDNLLISVTLMLMCQRKLNSTDKFIVGPYCQSSSIFVSAFGDETDGQVDRSLCLLLCVHVVHWIQENQCSAMIKITALENVVRDENYGFLSFTTSTFRTDSLFPFLSVWRAENATVWWWLQSYGWRTS